MQTLRPNVLLTGTIKNEFGLHFNQNLILHKGILQPISYQYLIQFSLISLFEKHRPGFHSKSRGLKQLTELLREGGKKRKKICITQTKSQQEFSILSSPTTVTLHYSYTVFTFQSTLTSIISFYTFNNPARSLLLISSSSYFFLILAMMICIERQASERNHQAPDEGSQPASLPGHHLA